jgi:hypothetical protein
VKLIAPSFLSSNGKVAQLAEPVFVQSAVVRFHPFPQLKTIVNQPLPTAQTQKNENKSKRPCQCGGRNLWRRCYEFRQYRLNQKSTNGISKESLAEWSVGMADALIAELNKEA